MHQRLNENFDRLNEILKLGSEIEVHWRLNEILKCNQRLKENFERLNEILKLGSEIEVHWRLNENLKIEVHSPED